MSRLFISHCRNDDDLALALKVWLVREGWSASDVLLDLDRESPLDSRAWREGEARCKIKLVVASPEWKASKLYARDGGFGSGEGASLFVLTIGDFPGDDPIIALAENRVVRLAGEPAARFLVVHPLTGRQSTVPIAEAALASLKRWLGDVGGVPRAPEEILACLRPVARDRSADHRNDFQDAVMHAEGSVTQASAHPVVRPRLRELSIDDLLRLAPRRRASFDATIAPAPPPAAAFPTTGNALPAPAAASAPPPPPDRVLPMPEGPACPAPLPPRASAPRGSLGAHKLLLRALGAMGAVLLAALVFYFARRGLRDHLGGWLGGPIHPAVLPPPPPATPRQESVVDLTVFAPPHLLPTFLVQVFVHDTDEDAGRVAAMAEAADTAASRRGVATLDIEIAYGETLDITLEAPGLVIADGRQTIVWRGRPRACAFIVGAPPSLGSEPVFLRVRAYREAIPVGQVTFAMSRDAAAAPAEMGPVGDLARRYRRAFLSYASSDRGEVVKRAQALRAGRIDFFHDLLSLEPGEHWEQRLHAEIDACDLFILFWSQAARKSPWVAREIAYALSRQTLAGSEGRPEILPILLEGPPPAAPPETLAYLHFNDPFLYVIADAEQRRARIGS